MFSKNLGLSTPFNIIHKNGRKTNRNKAGSVGCLKLLLNGSKSFADNPEERECRINLKIIKYRANNNMHHFCIPIYISKNTRNHCYKINKNHRRKMYISDVLLLLSYQDRARGQIKMRAVYSTRKNKKKIYRLFRIMVLCIQTFPQMNLQ